MKIHTDAGRKTSILISSSHASFPTSCDFKFIFFIPKRTHFPKQEMSMKRLIDNNNNDQNQQNTTFSHKLLIIYHAIKSI